MLTFGEWVKEALAHLWNVPAPLDDPLKALTHESVLREGDEGKLSHVESIITLRIKGNPDAAHREPTGEIGYMRPDQSDFERPVQRTA